MPTTDDLALRRAAAEQEGALLMQAENAYLKQRAIALNLQVRELTAENERLRALTDTDPEGDTDAPQDH